MRCFLDSKQSNEQRKDRLTEEIKAAYGFSDEQLIREMDDAIAHPDTSPELQAPENEFQLIMKKVEEMMKRAERQATPRISGVAGFTGTFPPARRRRKKMARMLLVAALLGVIGVGGVVTAVGRSAFQYERLKSNSGNEAVVWNNVPIVVNEIGNVEKAYNEIEEKLNIPVLRLTYMPEGMVFQNLSFEEQRAIITFEYNGYIARLVELGDLAKISNVHTSDRKEYGKLSNRLLDTDVILSRNELDNGQTEFSAEVITQKAYYYFSGIMKEDEFNRIVEKLRFN